MTCKCKDNCSCKGPNDLDAIIERQAAKIERLEKQIDILNEELQAMTIKHSQEISYLTPKQEADLLMKEREKWDDKDNKNK
jgi:hypothetical protein